MPVLSKQQQKKQVCFFLILCARLPRLCGMKYLISAYVTEPASLEDKRAYYAALATLPFDGYELPLLPGGALHADEAFLLANLAPGKDYVLSCIPATMTALGAGELLGLAAEDEAARARALALARQACAAVARLNAAQGRRAVLGVEVHSGPGAARGATSAAALQRSLVELAQWDWQGAEVYLEHCDAAGPHPPAKGFLALEEELAAVAGAAAALAALPPVAAAARAPARLGVVVQWARSVLETRDPATALAHVRAAAPLLAGVSFCGCSGADTLYGAWQDSHMAQEAYAPGSLLTAGAIADAGAALRQARPPRLAWVGSKAALRDAAPISPQRRADVHADLLAALRQALA